MHYTIKNPDIEYDVLRCGKTSKLMQDRLDDHQYFLMQYRCKQLICPSCFLQAQKNVKSHLRYAIYTFKMKYFTTITIDSDDYNDLNGRFTKMMAELSQYNFDSYKSKNRKTKKIRESYYKMINKTVKEEVNMMFHIRYVKHICILLAQKEGVQYMSLLDKRQFISDHRRQIQDYIKAQRKRFKRGKQGFDWYYGQDKRYCRNFKNYNKLEQYCRDKIMSNLGREFAFFRTLEWQENDHPHFHVLSNYYINYHMLNKYFPGLIVDVVDFIEGIKAEDKDYVERQISEYTLKYVLKETIENTSDSKSGKMKYDIISCSHNIKKGLFDEDEERDKKFRFVARYDRIAPESFIPLTFRQKRTEINEYIKTLPRSDLRYENPFMKAVRKKRDEVQTKNRVKGIKKAQQKINYHEYENFKSEIITKFLSSEIEKRINEPSIALQLDYSRMFNGMVKTPEQSEFIKYLNDERVKFLFLLGKAGTGKTTIVSEVFKSFPKELKVGYLSFAGKAVSRLNEKCGQKVAKTIHRYCSARFSELTDFVKNEKNLIDVDLVFVDEISMVNKEIFANLLNALPLKTKIILCGDRNQLNPVGSNSIIFELGLIKHEAIKYVELKQVLRSVDGVLVMADKVLQSNSSVLPYKTYSIEEVEEYHKNGFQIIANSNDMVRKINQHLSRNKYGITTTAYYNYNIGDKIMILQNDVANQVYNGDIVFITGYEAGKIELWDQQSDHTFFYDVYKSADWFQPAECFTVHKSQGSEWDRVLVVLDNKDKLLTANLLYTAITRAAKEVVIMAKSGIDYTFLNRKQENDEQFNIGNVSCDGIVEKES